MAAKYKKGMTLIEVIVTLLVVTILLGAIYMVFNQSVSDGVESINLELDSIEHNLSEAQFERWLFPLFDQLGVVVVSSDFTSPTVASPDSMIYVKNDPMYSIKEMINNINDISSTQKTKPMTESVLLKSSFRFALCDQNTYASYFK